MYYVISNIFSLLLFPDSKEIKERRVHRLSLRLRGPEPDVRELQDLQSSRFEALQRRMQTPARSEAQTR